MPDGQPGGQPPPAQPPTPPDPTRAEDGFDQAPVEDDLENAATRRVEPHRPDAGAPAEQDGGAGMVCDGEPLADASAAEHAGEAGDDNGGEPATAPVAPRWTGSAAVPAQRGRKRRRWLRADRDERPAPIAPMSGPAASAAPMSRPAVPVAPTGGPAVPPAPVHRDPTLDLRRADPETVPAGPPVDPWADADPMHELAEEYRVDLPGLPPTRAYTQIQPPPNPPPNRPPNPPTRPYTQVVPVAPPAPIPAPLPARPHRQAPPPRQLPAQRPPVQRPPAPLHPVGPQAPPPGWMAVQRQRRRRRWPWTMLVFTLATVGCCCGLPWYVAKPMWDQYPATAALPQKVSDLRLRDSDSDTTRSLELDMRAAHLIAEDTFAGVYRDGDGKRVTVFGATGFRFSPDKDLSAEVTRLTQAYSVKDARDVDSGVRGLYERCGTGRVDGDTVAVCTWADHGSVGTALFTRRSVADSADLLRRLRTAIITTK